MEDGTFLSVTACIDSRHPVTVLLQPVAHGALRHYSARSRDIRLYPAAHSVQSVPAELAQWNGCSFIGILYRHDSCL